MNATTAPSDPKRSFLFIGLLPKTQLGAMQELGRRGRRVDVTPSSSPADLMAT
jgi:hypothetical protein